MRFWNKEYLFGTSEWNFIRLGKVYTVRYYLQALDKLLWYRITSFVMLCMQTWLHGEKLRRYNNATS